MSVRKIVPGSTDERMVDVVVHSILTLREAAELLRTSESTLRYWRHRGGGPRSFKLGRRVMYTRADLDAWLEQQYDGEPDRHAG